MKNFLKFAVLCLLAGAAQSDKDCSGLAESCRQRSRMTIPEFHCSEDGAIYSDECEFLKGTCQTGSPLKSKGEACMSVDPQVALQYSLGYNTKSAESSEVPKLGARRRRGFERRKRNSMPYTPTRFETRFFENLKRNVDERLRLSQAAGVAAETAKLLYAVRDHGSRTYVRNLQCWAHGLGLSAVSVWNSQHGPMLGGTLISPRHLIWARHFSFRPNATLRFVDDSNRVFGRRLTALKILDKDGDRSFFGEDLAVGILDEDVPPTVSFARVLPKDMGFFRLPDDQLIPVFGTDQEGKALVADLAFQRYYASVTRVPQGLRNSYFEYKVGGDSGQPAFGIIDNQLVLLFINTLAGPGSGTPIVSYYDDINAMMAELGGDYQLTPVQLETFGDRSSMSSAYEAAYFPSRG